MTAPVRVGIHGFGRMGRLALRAGWGREDLEFVAIDEPSAEAETMALLTEFDSVQGRWDRACSGAGDRLTVDGRDLHYARVADPREAPWKQHGVELVLECSGAHRTLPSLEGHFTAGAQRVVVSAPVRDGAPNIVVGVNHDAFDLAKERVVTAASCTTNCLAPVVRVLHDALGRAAEKSIDEGAVTVGGDHDEILFLLLRERDDLLVRHTVAHGSSRDRSGPAQLL